MKEREIFILTVSNSYEAEKLFSNLYQDNTFRSRLTPLVQKEFYLEVTIQRNETLIYKFNE